MAINPSPLAFNILQVITGAEPNDRNGQTIRSAFERLNADLVIIADELTRLTNESSTADSIIQGILNDITNIQASLASLTATVTDHGNRLDLAEADIQTIELAVNSLNARVDALELTSGTLVTLTNQLQTDVSDLQALIATKANINSPEFTGAPTLANSAIPNISDNSGRLVSSSWVVSYLATAVSGDGFPPGTRMLFYQSSPPTGWQAVSGIDNSAIKVDNSSAGVSVAGTTFDAAFKSNFSVDNATVTIQNAGISLLNSVVSISTVTGLNTNPHSLTVAQLPPHSHQINRANGDNNNSSNFFDIGSGSAFSGTAASLNTGSGQGHSHSIPNHNHTSPAHGHGVNPHTHTANIHGHDLNLDVRHISVLVCEKT